MKTTPSSDSLLLDEKSMGLLSNIERKKYLQKLKLIKHIYEKGATSIAELFLALGISAPTCQVLVNELIETGILIKKGKGTSIGGRKPDLYALQDGSYYVLGIDMERFKTRMAIIDNNNNIVTEIKVFPIPITKNLSSIDQLCINAQELLNSSGINPKKLVGIGISMPGLINAQQGSNHTYLNTEIEGKTLKDELEDRFGYPVFIQNDVKCATLAESRLGLAQGKQDALIVLMDWGIGLGIVMDGKMREGSRGFSGEIGHIPFVDDGALCYCGKRGCLETVASGIALARMAKEGIKSGQFSMLNELSDQEIDKIEPQVVIDAANRGDQYAISILSKVGISLGKGIAILIQLFNPEVIILGGKIAKAKQYITIPIIHSVNTYSMTDLRENTEVVLSELEHNAGILGTAIIVIDNVINSQIRFAEQ